MAKKTDIGSWIAGGVFVAVIGTGLYGMWKLQQPWDWSKIGPPASPGSGKSAAMLKAEREQVERELRRRRR
jgi:hypothetical protein